MYARCCCCCRYCPPVLEGCPNYEGVLFQPRTFPTPHLGSVAYCYSFIYPFLPTLFFSRFLECSFPPLSYLPPISSLSSLKPYQLSTAPHFLFGCEAPPTWTSPAPAARQPPPLVPVPRAACSGFFLGGGGGYLYLIFSILWIECECSFLLWKSPFPFWVTFEVN